MGVLETEEVGEDLEAVVAGLTVFLAQEVLMKMTDFLDLMEEDLKVPENIKA